MRRDSGRRSRTILAGLAAAALVVVSGQSSTDEATPIDFRFDWIQTVADTPVRVALELGYFEEVGLDVSTTVGTGSTDAVTLTGAGQHDLAVANSLAVVVGVEQGVPVKSVGVLYQTDANGLISLPENPVNHPKELEGKRFGLQQGSSLIMYQALTSAADVDRSNVIEVPIGFGVEPLLEQQIDAMINFGDGERVNIRLQTGEDPVFLPLSDFGVDPYGQTLIVNVGFAEENPEAVAAFVEAYVKGLEFTLSNTDEAKAILTTAYSDVDADRLEQALDVAIDSFFTSADTDANGLLYQDGTRWEHTVDLARQVELTSSDVDPGSVFTNEFLPAGDMGDPEG